MNHPNEIIGNPSKKQHSKLWLLCLPWVVWALGALFYAYEYLLRVTPNAIAPDLMRAFSLSAESLGSLAAVYYLSYTVMQLPVGILIDRYGPRKLLTFASLMCALGTYLFVSPDLSIARIGRFLVGFGSAFAFVGVLKLSANWFNPHRFALLSGLASSLGVVGAIFGVVLMTALGDLFGWLGTVVYSAHFGIFLALIIFLVIRDQPSGGTSTVSPIEHERMTLKDIFRTFLKIIVNPHMWLIGVIGFLLYLPTTSFADMWGELYLEQARHMTKTEASWANACIYFGWGLFAPFSGYLSDRMKHRRIPMILSGFLAAIVITIILYVPNIPTWGIFVLLFVFGALYSAQPIVFAVAREISPDRASGTAVATTNMLVMLGGVFVQPFVGKLLDWVGGSSVVDGVHIYPVTSYQIALAILPIGLVLGALLTMCLPETFGDRYKRELKEL